MGNGQRLSWMPLVIEVLGNRIDDFYGKELETQIEQTNFVSQERLYLLIEITLHLNMKMWWRGEVDFGETKPYARDMELASLSLELIFRKTHTK